MKPLKLPSQESVNRLYVDLYTKIKKARDDARDHNKNLIILLGEEHANYNSHFLVHMITLIANRLGIKDVGREDDESSLDKKSIMEEFAPIDFSLPAFLRTVDRSHTYDQCPTPETIEERDGKREMGLNKDINTDFYRCLKMKTNAIDPKHAIPDGATHSDIVKLRNTEEVEEPMANAIRSLADKVPVVCSVGLSHFAVLKEKLHTHAVFPINCSAGFTLKAAAASTGLDDEARNIYLSRNDKTTGILTPAISLSPQIPPGVGIRMALEAETRHQMSTSDISSEEGQKRLRTLSYGRGTRFQG